MLLMHLLRNYEEWWIIKRSERDRNRDALQTS